jgi:predicted nucleic acid-binding Zn ribbon protein
MFDAFQKFLPKAAAEYNFSKQLQAVQICQEFRSLSSKIFPPEASTQAFPKSYDGRTLTIGVVNSAWAQQIAMQKQQILEAINKKYGPKTIQNIKIEMTSAPAGGADQQEG